MRLGMAYIANQDAFFLALKAYGVRSSTQKKTQTQCIVFMHHMIYWFQIMCLSTYPRTSVVPVYETSARHFP